MEKYSKHNNNKKTNHNEKRVITKNTDFSKQTGPLPKPPATQVDNHNVNLRGKSK